MAVAARESKSAATIRRRRNKNQTHHISHHSNATKREKCDELYAEDAEVYSQEMIQGPQSLQLLMSSDWLLFLGLMAYRIVNALVIQTSFVPDEYWQSIEVAHNMAFGYGYMTWEWRTGLRGYLYPLLFASVYKILGVLHLDNRILLTKLPRLIEALFQATGDLYLYKFARRLSGVRVARWSLLCQLTSWFTFYCGVRTLTNSMETSLSTIALYYFPWPSAPRLAQWKYIVLVGLAVIVRPTAAIMWLPLCMWHLYRYKHKIFTLLKIFALIGIALLSITTLIDRYFYGYWVFVPYNFLAFNVLSGQGTFYGSHPWHWYVTQGFPVVMATHLVPFVLCLRKCRRVKMLAVIAWTIFVYSLLGHKEFRFIFPVLPLAFFLCGEYLQTVTDNTQTTQETQNHDNAESHKNGASKAKSNQNSEEQKSLGPKQHIEKQKSKHKFSNWRLSSQALILFLVCTNLPLVLYTSLIHQRGTVDVMKFISDERKYEDKYNSMNVLFLMPCHSTPYYGYLHKNISMHFLTCEPNLRSDQNYADEADVFYQHPVTWLQENMVTMETFPSHLVIFNSLQPTIGDFAMENNYRECAKFFHTHVPEGRLGSHVIVLCTEKWLEGKERVKRQRTFLHLSL